MHIGDTLRSKHDLDNGIYKSLEKIGNDVKYNRLSLKDHANRSHISAYIHGLGNVMREAYKKYSADPKLQKYLRKLEFLEDIVRKHSKIDQGLLGDCQKTHTKLFRWFKVEGINPELRDLKVKGVWEGDCMLPYKAVFGNDLYI